MNGRGKLFKKLKFKKNKKIFEKNYFKISKTHHFLKELLHALILHIAGTLAQQLVTVEHQQVRRLGRALGQPGDLVVVDEPGERLVHGLHKAAVLLEGLHHNVVVRAVQLEDRGDVLLRVL